MRLFRLYALVGHVVKCNIILNYKILTVLNEVHNSVLVHL
jgi:hypothetical protein